MDKDFFQNIPMTMTERITMSSRPKQPKYARNKNLLVIGGSGSGKTRFFCKPSLLQAHSSYVCTDPKGTLLPEIGGFLERQKYRIKCLNLINFKKSMRYNPLAYIRSEKDILKLVNASMLVMALYNIVDSIFVSRISENALTAVSLVYPFQMLFISVAVGTGVGVNSLIARRLGERRQADADTAASTGQFLALVSALVFMFVYAVFPQQLLASFADDAEILDLATTYLRLCGGLCGFAIFATMAEKTIQATGDTIRPMLIQLAAQIA